MANSTIFTCFQLVCVRVELKIICKMNKKNAIIRIYQTLEITNMNVYNTKNTVRIANQSLKSLIQENYVLSTEHECNQ